VTIAGVVKEAATILVAVFYFHDGFTWLKGLGLYTIMVGVSKKLRGFFSKTSPINLLQQGIELGYWCDHTSILQPL